MAFNNASDPDSLWAKQTNGHVMFLVTLFDVVDSVMKLGNDSASQRDTYLSTIQIFYSLLARKHNNHRNEAASMQRMEV
jgi:hypothetical protein